MGLTDAYTIAIGRIPDLFAKIQDGQAPDIFTAQLLKDWGFTSSNDRALIPLLKELGFLSSDGKPTPRYHDYRNHARSKIVMAQAIREAYADLFLIKEHPTQADRVAIEGKFKSYHNVSDNVAGLMAKTFFSLLSLADMNTEQGIETPRSNAPSTARESDAQADVPAAGLQLRTPTGLHYNIQIHLPPTKDVEVYNAIFKSLKENIFNE